MVPMILVLQDFLVATIIQLILAAKDILDSGGLVLGVNMI